MNEIPNVNLAENHRHEACIEAIRNKCHVWIKER